MAMRMVSELGEVAPEPRRRGRAPLRSADGPGQAWALDAEPFHAEFDDLFMGLVDDRGLMRFRARAAQIWNTDDPETAEYVDSLRVHTPEEWTHGFEERHLAEWYRLLMVPYLRPVRGFSAPVLLKDGLPALGWTPSSARCLAWGRELARLAAAFCGEEAAAALAIVLPVGNKGWLAREDAEAMIQKLRSMDRRRFRDAQDLIWVVEDAFDVLTQVAEQPEPVLLLPPLA